MVTMPSFNDQFTAQKILTTGFFVLCTAMSIAPMSIEKMTGYQSDGFGERTIALDAPLVFSESISHPSYGFASHPGAQSTVFLAKTYGSHADFANPGGLTNTHALNLALNATFRAVEFITTTSLFTVLYDRCGSLELAAISTVSISSAQMLVRLYAWFAERYHPISTVSLEKTGGFAKTIALCAPLAFPERTGHLSECVALFPMDFAKMTGTPSDPSPAKPAAFAKSIPPSEGFAFLSMPASSISAPDPMFPEKNHVISPMQTPHIQHKRPHLAQRS